MVPSTHWSAWLHFTSHQPVPYQRGGAVQLLNHLLIISPQLELSGVLMMFHKNRRSEEDNKCVTYIFSIWSLWSCCSFNILSDGKGERVSLKAETNTEKCS